MLDWRHQLENVERGSPEEPPRVSFALAEAPGQVVWPPPASPVPLRAWPPRRPGASRQPSRRQLQLHGQPLSTLASEAEALCSVRAPVLHPQPPKATGFSADGLAGISAKAVVAPAAMQAWWIGTLYEPPAAATAHVERRPPLASIRTQTRSGEEAVALYAGSPTAKRAAWWACSPPACAPWGSTAEAAAAALPAAAVAARPVSLSAELADPLVAATEASLQMVGFAAEFPGTGGSWLGGSNGSGEAESLPRRLHFTFRGFGTDQPTVTAPTRLEPAGSGGGGPSLYSLVLAAVERGSASGVAPTPAPAERLQLLDVAGLHQALLALAAQGLPPTTAASLVRQHRLRVARHLAEAHLQVDVWDADSLLPVGTLSVPLRGLLLQGQPSAEVLLRVPVQDAGQALLRLDPSGASQACLHSVPLHGSFVLRLSCTGRRLQLPGDGCSSGSNGTCNWPCPPLQRLGGSQAAVVVRARPALGEPGRALLRELARQEGVPDGVAGDRLSQEVASRAALKVQRLLAFQALRSHGGGGTGGGSSAPVAELVERRLLGEVEAARERCKRDAILGRLQEELPSCLVSAVGEVQLQ